ncbi:MAG: hypothetical protein K0R78_449 [Pelosinus sp.]|jgi:hypothetical protein|nr:hypothetical protein [Pelosinus sp.]
MIGSHLGRQRVSITNTPTLYLTYDYSYAHLLPCLLL